MGKFRLLINFGTISDKTTAMRPASAVSMKKQNKVHTPLNMPSINFYLKSGQDTQLAPKMLWDLLTIYKISYFVDILHEVASICAR